MDISLQITIFNVIIKQTESDNNKMNISKSLFKQLTRCDAFPSLYDAYINKNNYEIDTTNFTKEELIKYLTTFNLDVENDDILEIIAEMFENDTNILKKDTIQLRTFLDVFNEIEHLAAKQLKDSYDGSFIYSRNTFKQKKYVTTINQNEYYCYIDIYNETSDKIRIFEVKSTTDTKFKDLGTTINKTRNHLFEYNQDKSLLTLNKIAMNNEKIIQKYNELFNPYTACGKYIYDIAIQKYIIENTLPKKKVEYYLVVLNSDYVFDGEYLDNKPYYKKDLHGRSLFTIIDVNKIVDDYYNIIDDKRKKLELLIINKKIKDIKVGPYCDFGKTTECPFKDLCFKKALVEYSILETPQKNYAFNNYKGIKHPTVYDFINDGIYMYVDAYPYTTRENYRIIYEAITKNLVHFDEIRIKEGLKQIKYPIYHLDFESMNNPLPRFRGEKVYSQSVFQYSLHIEKAKGVCDLVENHTEFLAKDHNDHREELVKQLIEDIDLTNGGTVMVYNDSFEKTRLKELANIFPKYKKELLNIHDHIVDLLQIIRGNKTFYEKFMELDDEQKETYAFYDKRLHGSFSIKKALPVFTNLSYSDLEVHNGTEAVYVYSHYENFSEDERKKAYNDLLTYCRQDTWSMVEILRGLNKMIGGK